MPTPLAKGVLIAASVLVAAGIAVYESPEFQQWLKESSQKVAHAIQSFGDDIQHRARRSRPSRDDPSTREDVDDTAEERRRQAREEIMARSRTLHDRRKRRKLSTERNRGPSFDNLVDAEGRLRSEAATASSTAVELDEVPSLPARPPREPSQQDGSSIVVEQPQPIAVRAIEPWEGQYEEEMRNAWNIDLPIAQLRQQTQSHASESLIDLTPTTEDFPDPDYSVPSLPHSDYPLGQSGYFSANADQRSRTISLASADSEHARQRAPISPLGFGMGQSEHADANATTNSSLASSIAHVEHEDTFTDDGSVEFGDGIRTPASAWTEVGSSVSGDEDHRHL